MTAYLRKLFTEAGFMEHTRDLKVCYCEVNKHSLVLKILSTYKGEIAGDYYPLQRLIQKGAIDCACKNNWEMPFRHYSIHTEEI